MKRSYSKKKSILLALIIILVLISLTLLLNFCQKHTSPSIAENTQSVGVVNSSGSIAIPGYEGLTLKADTKKQSVCLSNPESNSCIFRITLCLEDGTILWVSDEIMPGETSKPIKLKQKLEEGIYPKAKLNYACFKMNKERTSLNGAETVLTLRVKK